MKQRNIFYLLKSTNATVEYGWDFNPETGEIGRGNGSVIRKIYTRGSKRVKIMHPGLHETPKICLMWDENDNYLGFIGYVGGAQESNDYTVYNLSSNVYSIAIWFIAEAMSTVLDLYLYTELHPHYKQLKKRFNRANNQMFFRESLDGKITVFGEDYEIINKASLEETLRIEVYRINNSKLKLLASALLNKTDCKIDHFRKSIELNLTYEDIYNNVLDKYENTYDLIKLAPALTPIYITKRCITQIYVQGEGVVSSYAGGTYWETEVEENIDDEEQLINKYHFAKGPRYIEVNLSGFSYYINSLFRSDLDNNVWNASDGQSGSIVFRKIRNAGETIYDITIDNIKYLSTDIKYLSTDEGNAIDDGGRLLFDTYRIEIYSGENGSGKRLYYSHFLYGKDGYFTLAQGQRYHMIKEEGDYIVPIVPEDFYLGEYVTEYNIWGRILCDVSQSTDGLPTYDLPNDDFATPRRNYRKCIGLVGFDSPNSVIRLYQNREYSDTPTSYGLSDYGRYFIAPSSIYGQYFHPLARSAWANISLWVELYELISAAGYENWCKKYYRKYKLKNSYHIADVIKAILNKIDPSLKHEKTAEYSSFLYDHSGSSASILGGCDIYITQKTNILKGEYDQAAQKAEITFKQLMDMLRDCYRCYWFIDDKNRFRIEHISYFMNGLNYTKPVSQINLTEKFDKFNKKNILYSQSEIEYDKTELTSRYEFAWMDDVTKAMGEGLHIDIKNNYIKKDKVEEINVDGFTSDIDYMLFLPDNFSKDGFALLMADADKQVPIVRQSIVEEQQNNRLNIVDVQNWYASFNQLVWHYMNDMPGNNIECNNVPGIVSSNVKRSMKHNVEFPINIFSLDLYKLITTNFGNGHIEEVSYNIDTGIAEIELSYEPS